MLLDNLSINEGPAIFYNQGMRNVLEDHMEYLRNLNTTQLIAVEPAAVYRNANDLQGLFAELRIPPHLHWVVMRINHFTSFTANFEGLMLLRVPNPTEIDRIVQSYTTTNRIN